MQIKKFDIVELLDIIPGVYKDERGYFSELFIAEILQQEEQNLSWKH